ncbi:MAG: TonB family protein [Caulobacter sp.]|nr:TonB family protein [Caulobacter sp.]
MGRYFQTGAALIVAAMALATPAMAQDVVTDPSWKWKPSADDLARYYPDEAVDRSISGMATISCEITLRGMLEACEVASEYPYGLGFGPAAIKMMTSWGRFNPPTVNGQPISGKKIRIPVRFIAPTPGGRYIIFDPIWETAPSMEEVAAAWPTGSDREEGVAVLRCSMRADGGIADCIVAGQTNSDFGNAARSLKDRFRVRLTSEEAAKYADSDVTVSFRFINPARPEGRSRKVRNPHWVTSINPEAVLAVYPPGAADAGVMAGRGVADCLVDATGGLTDCKVDREAPADMGFGASALAIAALVRMNPWTDDGRPVVGGRIKLPIDFNLAGADTPAD